MFEVKLSSNKVRSPLRVRFFKDMMKSFDCEPTSIEKYFVEKQPYIKGEISLGLAQISCKIIVHFTDVVLSH